MSDAAVPRVEALLEHARWARSLARELVGGDAHQAEDLAQEALTAALARPPADEQHAQGWLGRVLRNRRVSHLRREDARQRAEPRAARAEAQPSTLELVEQAETQRRLVACVLSLEEPYRRVVLLRWFGDLPPREIARVEQLPLATVTSRLTRAHAKLREKLEREYRDEGRHWAQALAPLALADLRPWSAGGGASSVADSVASSGAHWLSGSATALAAAATLGVGLMGWWWWTARERAELQLAQSGSTAPRSESDSVRPAGSAPVESERQAALDHATAPPSAAMPTATLAATLTGALRGRVVLPGGAAAAGARVCTGDPQWLDRADAPVSFASVRADELGHFAFEALDERGAAPDFHAGRRLPSIVELVATHEAAAPSAALRVDRRALASGAAELILELRQGARVEGVVFGPDGKPAPLRAVRLVSDFGAPPRECASDQGGAFAFERVAPGRWTILSFPSDAELAEHRLGEAGSVAAFEHLAQRTLVLLDGAHERLELGRAPAHPVSVVGRVTARGAPQSALVQFVGPAARALELQRVARADEHGRYSLALAEPGPYLVKITAFGDAGTHAVERLVEVPAQPALERDFELPTGAIRGRVLDERGAPLSGASVRLLRERGGARSLLASFSDAKTSADDGSFAFEFLDDGAWSLSVHRETPHSTSNTAEQGQVARTAASVSAVLDVQDGRSVDDVVIQIAAAALLRGFLRAGDGAAVARGSVFVHGPDGRALTPFAWSASDADGRFDGLALAPGEWWVHARTATACSAPRRVRVDAGRDAELELELHAGAFVELEFPSVRAAATASLSVRDEAGREYAGLVDRALKSLDVLSSFEPGVARVGPLPPGLYRVQVHEPGRPTRRFDVGVEPGETRVITLP